MKRIVISGAGGFLGSAIAKRAANKGIPVIAITTHTDADFGDGGNVTPVMTEEFFQGKLSLSKEDIFINCMFPTNADGIKMANGLKNVYQTIRMARECGAGAMINVSSQSVYPSKRKDPARETDQLSLETPYAVGKYSTEEFTNLVFEGLPHCNVRLASLLGVTYEQRIINRMVDQALRGETLRVMGGMQRYGFLDVRDAAEGFLALAMKDAGTWKETYNLGRNDSCTLLEVAKAIVKDLKEIAGIDAQFLVTEGVDERNSAISADLFEQDVQWKAAISTEQTIRDVIAHKTGKSEK